MKIRTKLLYITYLTFILLSSISIGETYKAIEKKPFITNDVRHDKSKTLPELIEMSKFRHEIFKDIAPPQGPPKNKLNTKSSRSLDFPEGMDYKASLNTIFFGVDMPDSLLSVDGIGKEDIVDGTNLNLLPPDTNGDVGLQYYVQYINTNWAVFDKTTGARVSEVFKGNTFWAGFGGYCESDNHGDPVVLFDKIAQVWVFSQFGEFSSADAAGGGFQCFAISDKADLMDPTVTFNRYEYQFVDSLNDYPHIGIWTDESGSRSGYYMVTHEFTLPFVNATFKYASFMVFERDAMIAGQAARNVRFINTNHFGNTAFGSLPIHLESTILPPSGMCAPFVTNDRDNTNNGYYALWKLCVDWVNIGETTLSDPIQLSTTILPFDYEGVNRIAQPSPAPPGSELSSMSGFTMYRASARAYPTDSGKPVELVLNHTLHGGDGVAGVTWAHIALTGDTPNANVIFANGFENLGAQFAGFGSPSIIQQGFYSPDNESRWMGAISLDQAGNIGLAYTTASTSIFPSVRYTGRESTDPQGQLRAEKNCVVGGGVQTWVDSGGGPSRWGDYSSMSIDPVDQCTFWSSMEYVAVTGVANWDTRICSFRFDNCGEPDIVIKTNTPHVIEICSLDADPVIDLEIRAYGGFSDTVNLTSNGLTGGATLNFANNTLTTFPTNTTATLSNLATANMNTMNLIINADSTIPALNKTRDFVLDIALGNVVATTLQLPMSSAIDISISPKFSWDLLANADSYMIEIATDVNFTNIIETGVSISNSYQPESLLQASTEYFWRVTTANHCGNGATSSIYAFTTGVPGQCPSGTTDNIVFSEDVETDVSSWAISHGISPPPANIPTTDDQWFVATTMVNSGLNAFFALAPDSDAPLAKTDQYLVTPEMTLPNASQLPITLSFWNFQALSNSEERCDAAAILEISTDGGISFTKINNNNMLTDSYDGITFHLVDFIPITSELAWCANGDAPEFGPQEIVSVVKLDQWAGQTVKFRFRLATSPSTLLNAGGWWVDDVEVKGCN